jgi:hypothetical protein
VINQYGDEVLTVCDTRSGRAPGCYLAVTVPGPLLYPTPTVYYFVLLLSTYCSNIL